MEPQIKRVVIAGGGTAGWVTAAALSSQLGSLLDITLIESDQIGTVGVGEATIPTHKTFHTLLGIDEREFMRACKASFKLGIAFENWGQVGDRYIHSFGQIGKSTWMGDFQHMWMQAQSAGFGGDINDYCFELQAAEANKFATSDKAQINYAYHLDAGLYAQFLRAYSEARGVMRREGKISQVKLDPENGFISGLKMDNGDTVSGDLFIDCTGFKGLLIGEALGVGFDDWTHLLPMDRAWAVQTESSGEIPPYTRSIAQSAGWQWRIPLQHRVGNGHVFASEYMSEDEGRDVLMNSLDGTPVIEPRLIRFKAGQRRQTWFKNCIALGLSSGFLEPLESTAIHLIQIGATRLVQMFPFNGVNDSIVRHFNAHAEAELEGIRDFLILHYVLTERDDSEFWRQRKDLDIPPSLQQRIELYRDNALTFQHGLDLFRVDSWLQVMRGQRLEARGYHHMGKLLPEAQLKHALESLRSNIKQAVDHMPRHEDFLRQYCG